MGDGRDRNLREISGTLHSHIHSIRCTAQFTPHSPNSVIPFAFSITIDAIHFHTSTRKPWPTHSQLILRMIYTFNIRRQTTWCISTFDAKAAGSSCLYRFALCVSWARLISLSRSFGPSPSPFSSEQVEFNAADRGIAGLDDVVFIRIGGEELVRRF